MEAAYREIAAKLRAARRVLFITGAGISADSGLPTYRGVGGLYNDEATEDACPSRTRYQASVCRSARKLPGNIWRKSSAIAMASSRMRRIMRLPGWNGMARWLS